MARGFDNAGPLALHICIHMCHISVENRMDEEEKSRRTRREDARATNAVEPGSAGRAGQSEAFRGVEDWRFKPR